MAEFIRFNVVEVGSQVWFMDGDRRCACFRVTSFLLIPSYQSGYPVITESLLPEIFMQ